MIRPKEADLVALLDVLRQANVEFIVVGGAAAVLHGAPTSTLDLDIVHENSDDNTERLLAVLRQLDTVHRDLTDRRIEPTIDALRGAGQLNLSTDLGPLDVLCRLDDGRGYDQLRPKSVILSDGDLEIRVLDLETLIEIKAQSGRAKDRIVVPLLAALLRESDE